MDSISNMIQLLQMGIYLILFLMIFLVALTVYFSTRNKSIKDKYNYNQTKHVKDNNFNYKKDSFENYNTSNDDNDDGPIQNL